MSRPPEFPSHDLPLKADVRLLGDLLGQVLQELEGEALFQRVEAARQAAIRRRAGEEGAEKALLAAVAALDADVAVPVMRAFSLYFGLVNMAERIHRVRRLREADRAGVAPAGGSLEAVVASLRRDGIGAETVTDVLRRLSVTPVFTAHPTEAIRLAILAKEQRLAQALLDRVAWSEPTESEEAANLATLDEEVRATWQTEEHLESKVVADEVEHVVFYLVNVIYDVLPELHASLESTLEQAYGYDVAAVADRPILRFGSWVGGDMDGNPAVGPQTVVATLERQRELILGRYIGEVEDLAGRLTQSPTRTGIEPDIAEAIETAEAALPKDLAERAQRFGDTPYRRFLTLVADRLRASRRDLPGAYDDPEAFLSDLRTVHQSLVSHGGASAGGDRVRALIRRVEAFGFHLATLDLRQDARVHREVIGELYGLEGFPDLSRDERQAVLESGPPTQSPGSPAAKRAFEVMTVIGSSRERFGKDAIGPYIISMAEGVDDALAVMCIARAAGLVDDAGDVPLDIVPLFETVDDLRRASDTMAALLVHDDYAAHLSRRERRQMVMLGYSDSAKDSGIASSRWSLIQAQEDLANLEGMDLTVFHGRGGSVSRGGSRPRQAVLAEPPSALNARLRLTEQGEIIHAKYGLRGLARRTLELATGGVIEAMARAATSKPEVPSQWRDAASALGVTSRDAFRTIVHESDEFWTVFREATPIDVIERLKIGSRPASRRKQQGIADLRAIPWVFAWTQTRLMLPGWLGLLEGLDRVIEVDGLDAVRKMAREWRFFRNLLQDVEMVLAKADPDIAARYFELGGGAASRLGAQLLSTFAQTRDRLLEVLEQSELLARHTVLARAIRLRNPYVDPMNFLQIETLARWRSGDRTDDSLARILFTTVKGIARGLQNTG